MASRPVSVFLHPPPTRDEAARRDGALRDCVDLAVARAQRRLDERAALDAVRIADGGDRHIDGIALAHKGRQRRRHHDSRYIIWLERTRIDGDAEALEHIADTLHRLLCLVRVARARETDDEAVADELIAAHPLHFRDVLDARHRGIGRSRKRRERRRAHRDKRRRTELFP